jgi:hypothetical protein
VLSTAQRHLSFKFKRGRSKAYAASSEPAIATRQTVLLIVIIIISVEIEIVQPLFAFVVGSVCVVWRWQSSLKQRKGGGGRPKLSFNLHRRGDTAEETRQTALHFHL